MRYPDCIMVKSDCAACSLSSYGRDCRNNSANFVAYRRNALGLRQKDLAELSGMHITQVQKIERGEIKAENISLKKGLSLAAALKIDPEELLD
jgi:ribosome-binding protein aMBF1 (putative translation factor)